VRPSRAASPRSPWSGLLPRSLHRTIPPDLRVWGLSRQWRTATSSDTDLSPVRRLRMPRGAPPAGDRRRAAPTRAPSRTAGRGRRSTHSSRSVVAEDAGPARTTDEVGANDASTRATRRGRIWTTRCQPSRTYRAGGMRAPTIARQTWPARTLPWSESMRAPCLCMAWFARKPGLDQGGGDDSRPLDRGRVSDCLVFDEDFGEVGHAHAFHNGSARKFEPQNARSDRVTRRGSCMCPSACPPPPVCSTLRPLR